MFVLEKLLEYEKQKRGARRSLQLSSSMPSGAASCLLPAASTTFAGLMLAGQGVTLHVRPYMLLGSQQFSNSLWILLQIGVVEG